MRRETGNAMRLRPARRYAVYAVGLLLWGSGALWLVAHHWWMKQGEYGPETSPAEPWSLRAHGGSAMAGTALMGLLWGVHILRGWQARRGRWSGGLLFGLLFGLAVSGYLLYYVGDDDLRGWVSFLHWTVGLAALPLFLLHRLLPKR